MAPSRLSDSQKRELVVRYRAGESTAELAEAFGCSANTVSRTVRALVTPEDYEALKKGRARGAGMANRAVIVQSALSPQAQDDSASLALDDADDFGDDPDDGVEDDENEGPDQDFHSNQDFHTVAVLTGQIPLDDAPVTPACRPIGPDALPDSVYLLVDKLVELDPQPLRAFQELGALDAADQDRQALGLYSSPRTAKRQCGRNQRVIKVPDSQVFARTSRYLIARGITRLVLDGALIALDA